MDIVVPKWHHDTYTVKHGDKVVKIRIHEDRNKVRIKYPDGSITEQWCIGNAMFQVANWLGVQIDCEGYTYKPIGK